MISTVQHQLHLSTCPCIFPGTDIQVCAAPSNLQDMCDLTRTCKAQHFKAQLEAASGQKVNRKASPLRSAPTHVMGVLASLKPAVIAKCKLFIDHAENITPGPVTAGSFHSTVTMLICICMCIAYVWIWICMYVYMLCVCIYVCVYGYVCGYGYAYRIT